jgi:hypothetical protein
MKDKKVKVITVEQDGFVQNFGLEFSNGLRLLTTGRMVWLGVRGIEGRKQQMLEVIRCMQENGFLIEDQILMNLPASPPDTSMPASSDPHDHPES